MADQVNPVGSLPPGLPLGLLVAAASAPPPEKARPAKVADTPPSGRDSRPSAEASKAALTQLNSHLQNTGSELRFQMDESTGRTIFKVVDPKDGTVLLQVPSDEMLALARNLQAMDKQASAAGALLDRNG